MSEGKSLTKQVEEINAELRALGSAAVQEIKMMKDGKVIGQVRYGYKPQYVFDAVNSILLPENWRYEVVSKEIFDSQVVAEVRLFIRVNDNEWICKGSQTGQMQIVKGNVGDSYKGAITDAIKKCLSFLLCSPLEQMRTEDCFVMFFSLVIILLLHRLSNNQSNPLNHPANHLPNSTPLRLKTIPICPRSQVSIISIGMALL